MGDVIRLYPTGYHNRGKAEMVRPPEGVAEPGDVVRYAGLGGWQWQRVEAEKHIRLGDTFIVAELKVRPSFCDYQLGGQGDRWFNSAMFELVSS